MKFTVERMDLTDAQGVPDWARTSVPRIYAVAHGCDASGVLAAVVAREGGVQLGVTAAYTDGQAVMLAQKGDVVFALRAVPRASVPIADDH